ncbi:MAG: SsrA-binding protein SmpB [Bacilli bacterium]
MIIMEINNKKAYYDYYVEKELESGIVLKGTEIKSIRKGSADLKDSYVIIRNNEAFIINMYIAKYEEGNRFNHEERRTRKLLLHKREIVKLKSEIIKDGYTIIPLKLYLKAGKAKILIGVCKGKHLYDKRETIKKRDLERETRQYEY